MLLGILFSGRAHGAIASSPTNIASIAALKALSPGQYPVIQLTGYYSSSIGGAGLLYWNSTSVQTPDSCTCYKSTSTGSGKGRWLRPSSPIIDARQCGAKGDGVTNDAVPFQQALTVAGLNGWSVFLPDGIYLTNVPILIPSGVVLYGNGTGSEIKAISGFSGNGYTGVLTVNYSQSNTQILNLKVNGNLSGVGHHDYSNIALLSCSNVWINNVTTVNASGDTTGSGGDGLYISPYSTYGNPSNIHVENLIADSNYRQGATVVAGSNITFLHCTFKNTTGTNPGSGFDLEPNDSNQIAENIHLYSCVAHKNGGRGFQIYNGQVATIKGVSFEDCKADSNGASGFVISGEQHDNAISLQRCEFKTNGNDEIVIGKSLGVLVKDCWIHNSSYNGIVLERNTGSRTDNFYSQITSNTIQTIGKNGILFNYGVGGEFGYKVYGNTIINCSNGSAGTYFPINFAAASSHNFAVSIFQNSISSDANFSGSGYASYGINIPVNCNKIKASYNDFNAMTIGQVHNLGANNFIQFNFNSGLISDAPGDSSTGINNLRMTNNLTIDGVNGEGIVLNRQGGGAYINFQNAGLNRWVQQRNNTTGSFQVYLGDTSLAVNDSGKVKYSRLINSTPVFTVDIYNDSIVADKVRFTNPLAVASGGTGVTSSTGSGSVMLSASPSTTGTLTAAAVSASGDLVTTTDLRTTATNGRGLWFNAAGTFQNGIYKNSSNEVAIRCGATTDRWGVDANGILNNHVSGSESTGAGTALLSTNCPAVTAAAPYKWIKLILSDASVVYIPAWK